MADSQSNARLRAESGAPTSGVIHVRTRLTANFTVMANSLAQRPGSAVTVGVAAYILSLPDGDLVSIEALCAHFTEGEILISRALRELEDAGYLVRRRVRGSGGLIGTRTYFHDVPERGDDRAAPPRPRKPAVPVPVPAPEPDDVALRDAPEVRDAAPEAPGVPDTPEADAAAGTGPGGGATPAQDGPVAPPPPLALPDADPHAVAILASLRIVDARLGLSRREVAALAPAVADWLARGIGAEQITEALTVGLPAPLRARPARILAYRLGETPVALPAAPAVPLADAPPDLLPWQTCDGGCERAYRAARPGNCLDCDTPATSDVPAVGDSIKTVRAALTDRADRAHRRGRGRRSSAA
ncbi:hypothetical protein OG413_15105 [Streptomyces sp. NBC_01433]|uniref:hypothetical protein n=1 Tax=Streptomyces sp. NBC_01433 TaxID=2903864 RepID=UPI00225528C1|nr:hypothetical protein [Streptomyces sp. NBC_01433]MCX4676611.1 hypothetical protein [Streptomyces sp. NBC_01433]